jgi:hypothetical protein
MGAITMDKTDIFVKSAKGEQEISTRVNKLPIKHRSVLIMIDGTTSEQTLLSRISGMIDGKTIVSDLETNGFIVRKVVPKLAVLEKTLSSDSTRKHSMLESIVDRVKEMSEEYEKT